MPPLFGTGLTLPHTIANAISAAWRRLAGQFFLPRYAAMRLYFPEYSTATRFTLAVLAAVLAVALEWAMHPWVGGRIPFLFLLPVIFLTTTLFGLAPAVMVLCIGFVNGMYLLDPVLQPNVAHLPDRLSLAAFAVVGLLLVILGSRVRLVTRHALAAEQRLNLVQQDTGVGLFEIDLTTQTIFASPTLYKIVGRTPDARRNQEHIPIEEWNAAFLESEVRKARAVLWQQVRAGVSHYEREHRVTLPNGEVHCLLSKVHLERDDRGQVVRARGASIDITDRKRMDALLNETRSELAQQLEDLQRLHELSSRLLELNDLPGQLNAILQTLAEFHSCEQGVVSLYDAERGYLTVETGIGFAPANLAHLSWVPLGAGACGAACLRGERIVVEDTETDPTFGAYRQLARDLGFRAVHSTPLVSRQGEVIGVITVHFAKPCRPSLREIRLTDICARKAAVFVERARAQHLAQEIEQRFQIALDASAVPFMIFAPVRAGDGTITDFRWLYVNRAVTRILGKSPQELVGRSAQEVYPGFWIGNELFNHYVAVAEHGETREFEIQAKRTVEGWFHVIASPLKGAVAIWSADVSDRKRHEKALQEADRRKDEFLATLAHELRNPLAPIRQAAAISKMPAATEAQKRWSHEVIERQLQHMALLLDDLLDVSRITRGTLQLRKSRTELVAVVDAAIETARPLIDAKQHTLSVELPAAAVLFEADQLRIAQVLANLLMNAAKYTDSGGNIGVRAACVDDAIEIQVSDNGIGIKPDSLREIFQMFTQVRSTQDRSNGGLGIGLALAKGLIELHGGTICAHSRGLGQGSVFTLRLPGGGSAASTLAPATEPLSTTITPKRKILIADDNRDAAESLAMLLRMDGHAVDVAFDGEAALAEFTRCMPEIVLLDIGMPKMSGTEVAQAIRRQPAGQCVTLVAITGWGQERDKRETQAAGFDHHLTKPVDPTQLHALLFVGADKNCRAAATPLISD